MSEHFYDVNGNACHTQPTKTKGAKNPTRPTTIADAKRLKLLPSVSSILKQAANPALDRYKAQQIIKACFNCPVSCDEDFETYARHIMEKADKERDEAADLGTNIHAALEQVLVNPSASYDESLSQFVTPALNKVNEMGITVVERELRVVSEYGYAGTTDVAFTHGPICGILDFKSVKTKPEEPIIPRQGHAAQIAAYHVAYWSKDTIKNNTKGYNVYISTTEPGRIDVVEYDAPTLRSEFGYFLACFDIWKHRYGYDPRSAFAKVANQAEGADSQGNQEIGAPSFTD